MQTQEKIDEAKFFLDKMRENYLKSGIFRFYLSAFLSASRSIIWIMKSEYKEAPGFRDWYAQRNPAEGEQKAFNRITALRNESVHQKPIATRRMVYSLQDVPLDFDPGKFLNKQFKVTISKADKEGNQTLSFVGDSGEVFQGQITDHRMIVDLQNPEDLLELCENYLSIVKAIYQEWLAVNKGDA